jgi:hypothetical protein
VITRGCSNITLVAECSQDKLLVVCVCDTNLCNKTQGKNTFWLNFTLPALSIFFYKPSINILIDVTHIPIDCSYLYLVRYTLIRNAILNFPHYKFQMSLISYQTAAKDKHYMYQFINNIIINDYLRINMDDFPCILYDVRTKQFFIQQAAEIKFHLHIYIHEY